ncbi:hypothetical protein TNCT_118121 [Trichonephila clavata]|uniref:Uncharacterized protein n=1 Tax=Trichonephila clavata TaxID=2740835 RepID=A0A8X6HMX3_TRICU|nr:hypothetical protein TNCT_118121 [Trichonephila clavata]
MKLCIFCWFGPVCKSTTFDNVFGLSELSAAFATAQLSSSSLAIFFSCPAMNSLELCEEDQPTVLCMPIRQEQFVKWGYIADLRRDDLNTFEDVFESRHGNAPKVFFLSTLFGRFETKYRA